MKDEHIKQGGFVYVQNSTGTPSRWYVFKDDSEEIIPIGVWKLKYYKNSLKGYWIKFKKSLKS